MLRGFIKLGFVSLLLAVPSAVRAEAAAVCAEPTPQLEFDLVDAMRGGTPERARLALSVSPQDVKLPGIEKLGVAVADNVDAFVAAIGLTGQGGALILDVTRDSPAARAGFEPGDLIVSVDGAVVQNAAALERLLRAMPIGPIEAEIIRIEGGADGLLYALRQSAAAGNRDAVLALGDARLFGLVSGSDPASAEDYYQRAYSMGDPRAAYRLGWMYATGRGVAIDYAVATRWYRLAAEARLPAGEHALALTYWNGRYWTGQALVADAGEAVRLFKSASLQGVIDSELYLGIASETGTGTAVDAEAAADHYDRAIAAGSVEAMLRRATMLDATDGAAGEHERAVSLLVAAADLGSVAANFRLGTKYRTGQGVRAHPIRAMDYFSAAAMHGDAASMSQLAQILLSGYGVTRDEAAAMQWYFRAYQAGDPDAGYILAIAYLDGIGVAPDRAKVAGFLFDAIRRGSDKAMSEMKSNADAWDQNIREQLQELLQANGLYSGKIDGVIGGGTIRALEAAADR